MKKIKKILLITTVILMMCAIIGCANEKKKDEEIVGGWTTVEDGTITEDLREIFDKAMEGFTGVGYVPVKLLKTQLVSGTNYKFLCDAATVYPGAATKQAIVTVYVDLDGNARIIDVEETEGEDTSIANPFVKVSTLQEAIDGAGFDAEIPEKDDVMGDARISYIKDMLIESVYGEDNALRIRKEKATKISAVTTMSMRTKRPLK